MSRALEILRTLRTTPPLPAVAQRVLEVVRDPGYSLSEVVDLISTDPALTARVLRLTNSAAFALPTPATSVAAAVDCIGPPNLVKLVLMSCAANQYREVEGSIYGSADDLWRHSVAVGNACRWLAIHSGFDDPATAFTVGIMHNVGKVALVQTLDNQPLPEATGGTSYAEREQALFGIDHAAAAGVIADSWALPRDLGVALRHHHNEERIGEGPLLSAILSAADDLTLAAGVGNLFDDLAVTISPAARQRLRLSNDDIEQATRDVMAALAAQSELLNPSGMSSR